jgi:hypothetical protein
VVRVGKSAQIITERRKKKANRTIRRYLMPHKTILSQKEINQSLPHFEHSSIRFLAEETKKRNCELHISYGSGGWQVTLTDHITNYTAEAFSFNVINALQKCFGEIEERRKSSSATLRTDITRS